MHIVVRNTGSADLAIFEQLVQPSSSFIRTRQPIRAMHEKQVNVVDPHEAQGFFRALHDPRSVCIVESRFTIRMKIAGHVDATLGDDLQLVAQTRFFLQSLANEFFHFVKPVDLSRVDRRNAEFEALVEAF